jgi:hypothetical protein
VPTLISALAKDRLNPPLTVSVQSREDNAASSGADFLMMATLVAFPALGFFAATLLTLARFLVLVFCAAAAVVIVGVAQGMTILNGLGLGLADLALSQVGYGLGLVWVASTRSHTVKD